MSLIAAGTIVGFESKDWELRDAETGALRQGTTHTLSVSTGDGVETLKVPQEIIDLLGHDVTKLRQTGRPVVARCRAAARDSNYGAAKLNLSMADIEFVRLADLKAFGYEMDIYVEDDEPSSNGAPLASV